MTLQASCIVLAHPRTGSSLIMQTFAILGMPWIGSFEREDLGPEPNPQGYFEDRELLNYGFTPEVWARLRNCAGHAAKIAFIGMVKPERNAQWQRLAAEGATLIIPFRHPLESAYSNRIFAAHGQPFLQTTTFLFKYHRSYVALANLLTGPFRDLAERTITVPYQLHLDNPEGFVELLRKHAGLPKSPSRQAKAIANIRPELYRYRWDELPPEALSWYERMPARDVYEALCVKRGAELWEHIASLSAR